MFIYKQTEFSSKDGADLWTVGHMEGDKFIPESDHGRKEDAVERVKELNGGGSGHLVRPDGRINREIQFPDCKDPKATGKVVGEIKITEDGVDHTPGPWEWIEGPGDDYQGGKHHRELIATTDKGQGQDSILYHGANWPMTEANARLIAAAPELLEALKEAQKLLHPLVMKMKVKDHFHEHNVLANVIVKAIAKAEGRDVA